jgi:hypothetical protein
MTVYDEAADDGLDCLFVFARTSAGSLPGRKYHASFLVSAIPATAAPIPATTVDVCRPSALARDLTK